MVAVRVHPLKPKMIVIQGPKEVDQLAIQLAEQERIESIGALKLSVDRLNTTLDAGRSALAATLPAIRGDRLLKVGNWVNESCVSCHTEKRGPFLFEHAAGRESCISCHDPHGSTNDRLLVAKVPMLCQRCHIGTRHPSTIYDGAAVTAKSNRIAGRACVNCHSQIHGSNHPSGQSLTR